MAVTAITPASEWTGSERIRQWFTPEQAAEVLPLELKTIIDKLLIVLNNHWNKA